MGGKPIAATLLLEITTQVSGKMRVRMRGALQSALRPLLDRMQTRSHSSFLGLRSQPLAGDPSPEALKAVSLFQSETVGGANIFTGQIPAPPILSV